MLMLSRTQKRFFIIYLSFFVCLLVMFIPVYFITLDELKKNTVETSEAVLAGGLQRLEDELRLITIAADTLYSNQQVVSLSYMNGPITALDAYKIRQATTYYKDITEILQLPSYTGLVLKNNKVIAAGSLYLTGEAFYHYSAFMAQSAADYTTWLDQINVQGRAYAFLPMHVVTAFTPRDAVLFTVSLPLNTQTNRTVFFAVLNQSDLLSLLALPETLANARLTMRDADGRLLIEHDPGDVTDFVTISQTSSTSRLSVDMHISAYLFLEGLTRYRNLFLIGMAAYILLGLILSVIYSQSNARPLIRMMTAAANTCEEIGGNLSRLSQSSYPNGYQYLNDFISQVDTRLKANKLLLLQQENQLRINLFERLIHGEVFMSHTFDMAERYLTGFPTRYRMVLIKLFLPAELEPSRYAAKQIELRSILDPVLPSNSTIHFSANLVVIILPCGYLDDREECETMLGSWCEQLTADADLDVRMAVSAAGSGLQQLSEFFHQLQNLLRLTDHLSQPRPLFMEDQKPILVLPDHGKQHSTYFYEHIIRGQPDMALNLLREDIELLRQSGYVHEADVQQLFFAYRHALAMALILLDDDEAISIELPQYEARDNLDHTFAGITTCLEQISQVFQNRQRSSTESFERTVLAMIDDSLANPDLYIRMVTEHFAISESTLQRTMHKATGKSFFEYVDLKRMTRARELLSKTDQPINQVMAQCGYTTLNTFYKAFKRRYGMSPTAMRESKRPTD